MSNNFNNLYTEAYLKALRLVSEMDEYAYIQLCNEMMDIHEIEEEYSLESVPNIKFSAIEFDALKDCVFMRRWRNNNPICKPRLVFPASFVKARKKFYKEMKKYKFASTDWITNLSEEELI